MLGYKTEYDVDSSLKRMAEFIKKNGVKKFVYNYDLEINNELTPKHGQKSFLKLHKN